jgi:glycosyltransferase involved in cell wall biosynthesis
LRAFAKLAEHYPQLRLTFVGVDTGIKGADGTVYSFLPFVQRFLPDGLSSRIEFRGPLDRSEVMSLRPKHFATIIASRHEVTPYSVLEAMSFGCPVIATNVGGIPELIEKDSNGLLVPDQDPDALASACAQLLNDQETAARLGHQAWRDCRNLYCPERIAKNTAEAYQDAIDIFGGRDVHL